MAQKFGRVVERHGKDRSGWCIDFGRRIRPRYLTSARGAKFESREMAQAILDAIRVKVARGVPPQVAVDEFAPVTGERLTISHWAESYVDDLRQLVESGERSPTYLREVIRSTRPEGYWSFWDTKGLSDVDAFSVRQFGQSLRARGLSPKSVKNILGYFRAFLSWLRRMERIERVPAFPVVSVKDHRPTIISPRTQSLILAEIRWEDRGAFLACAHGLRPGASVDTSNPAKRGHLKSGHRASPGRSGCSAWKRICASRDATASPA